MRKLPGVLLLFLGLLLLQPVQSQTPLLPRDTAIKGPQTFAIILGISKYKYVRPLNFAHRDAELFRDFLRSPGGGSVADRNIFCLLNEEALNGTFWTKGFQWLKAKQLQAGDQLFIYLAGHGDAIDEDQFFFLGYDCNPKGDKNNYLVGGAIQLYNLKKKIGAETKKGVKVFLVMDACRTNELPGGEEGMQLLNTAITEKKAGEVMMLATGAGQESLEDASIGNGHGLFTWYLVEGLSGLADNEASPDKKITLSEIRRYVDRHVPDVARRFRRKQEPVFCCDEFGNEVVSRVDEGWLKKWLEEKNKSPRGGNAVAYREKTSEIPADSSLLETYRRFNQAVRDVNLSGTNSAESLYLELEKKFPGNPYTLDAQSSLAAAFINQAQRLVNDAIGCGPLGSERERMESRRAGEQLEKAIRLIQGDDPDLAASLQGRKFFLLSAGAEPASPEAFAWARACQRVSPTEAYADNWLSRLHLAAGAKDSAWYYANRAAQRAPKWPCVLTALALVQGQQPAEPEVPKKKEWPVRKSSFGFHLGSGLSLSAPNYSGNVNSGYTDVESKAAGIIGAGVLGYFNLGNRVAIRPSADISYGNTDIYFLRRPPTGGQVIRERVSIQGAAVQLHLPFIVRLHNRKNIPYFIAGPSWQYLLSQDNSSASQLPVKQSLLMGELGFGVDFYIPRTGMMISPELKFASGLSDMRESTDATAFARALSDLRKRMFTAGIYLRKR